MTFLYLAILMVSLYYLLWVFFLAVMKLRDIRDDGKLIGLIKAPAYLTLAFGYVIDMLGNLLMSVFLLEIPQELTVSKRTARHAKEQTRRGAFSRWLRKSFLAPADKKGGHD